MSTKSIGLEFAMASHPYLPDDDGVTRDWLNAVDELIGDKDYLESTQSTRADHLMVRALIAVSCTGRLDLRVKLLELGGYIAAWVHQMDVEEGEVEA